MGKDQGTSGTEVTDEGNTKQLKEQIEQIEATREELGDTVEALAAKADLKAQANKKVQLTKASISSKKEQMLSQAKEVSPEAAVSAASGVGKTARQNPVAVAVAGAFALGLVAGWLTKD